MSSSTGKKASTVEFIGDLLENYECPVPYHQFRAILIGYIVSPIKAPPPIEIIKNIWGGKMPNIKNMEELSSFMNNVFMRYWNSLSDNRNSKMPFFFKALKIKDTEKSLAELCVVRRQEIGGFLFGFTSGDAEAKFPEIINKSIAHLEEIFGYFESTHELIQKKGIGKTPKEISNMTFLLNDMDKIAQSEINDLIKNCLSQRVVSH